MSVVDIGLCFGAGWAAAATTWAIVRAVQLAKQAATAGAE